MFKYLIKKTVIEQNLMSCRYVNIKPVYSKKQLEKIIELNTNNILR